MSDSESRVQLLYVGRICGFEERVEIVDISNDQTIITVLDRTE